MKATQIQAGDGDPKQRSLDRGMMSPSQGFGECAESFHTEDAELRVTNRLKRRLEEVGPGWRSVPRTWLQAAWKRERRCPEYGATARVTVVASASGVLKGDESELGDPCEPVHGIRDIQHFLEVERCARLNSRGRSFDPVCSGGTNGGSNPPSSPRSWSS